MIRQTMTFTRPDTTVEFWVLVQPSAYIQLANPFVLDGTILNFSRTLSEDGLTFTRIMDFVDEAGKQRLSDAYDANYPNEVANRDAYNVANNHTCLLTWITM